MDLDQAIRARGSVKSYDPDHVISDADLVRLFELVVRSPSSFNLQHWRFVLVKDAERKGLLQAAAYNQTHIGQCSVDVVVFGKLAAHEDAPAAWADTPAEVQERMLPMIEGFYGKNTALQRDEAIRSGSLAAMTLMLAAESMGLSTCPMIGFDPKRVAELCGVGDDHVPVMIVTLGKGAAEARPSSRMGVDEVVRVETLDGVGLTA